MKAVSRVALWALFLAIASTPAATQSVGGGEETSHNTFIRTIKITAPRRVSTDGHVHDAPTMPNADTPRVPKEDQGSDQQTLAKRVNQTAPANATKASVPKVKIIDPTKPIEEQTDEKKEGREGSIKSDSPPTIGNPNADTQETTTKHFSAGAIAGLIITAAAIVGLIAVMATVMLRKNSSDDPYDDLSPMSFQPTSAPATYSGYANTKTSAPNNTANVTLDEYPRFYNAWSPELSKRDSWTSSSDGSRESGARNWMEAGLRRHGTNTPVLGSPMDDTPVMGNPLNSARDPCEF